MILEIAVSVYLPHFLFGTVVPLGEHDYICTLELQLLPYCLATELLVLKIIPNYSLVCVWLHYHPKETMMSPA